MGTLTVTFLVWGFSLPVILVVMVLVNSAGSLFTPASQAIVAALVPKDSLEDATGLLSSSNSSVGSVGSALGGIVVATLGPAWGLGTNALTYALSAIFLFQIASELGVPKQAGATEKKSLGKDFTEGMGYVRKSKLIPVTFGYLPVNLLSVMVWSFLVVYSAARFGTSALDYGALAAASAAGGALGALIPGRFPIRRRAGMAMGLGLVLEGSMALVLTYTGNIVVAFFAVLAWGLEIGLVNTVYYATLQAVVPRGVLGRVMSIGDFGSFAAIPGGLVLGGLLIEKVGVATTYLYVGAGLLVCASILLSLPSFRSFGRERLSAG
jgi:predicted MFS family arabinose efflux permease